MNVGQPPLLRRLNETAVLEALRKSGPMSRAELSRQLSLSKSTISQVVAELLRRGLVREVATERPRRAGRTATLLDIAPEAGFVAGADIGGTLVRVAVADLKGETRARLSASTAREGLAALVDQLADMVHQAMAQAGTAPGRLLAAGVGVPGAVDTATGAVRLCPNLSFLDGVTLGSLLEERLRCGVVVDNDVNLGAIGEKWRGCADRATNFAYMAVGTGVGMGVVLDAALYRGTHGFAGEVGYLPVPVGEGHRQLEEIVAGPAIARAYLEHRGSAEVDGTGARRVPLGSGSSLGVSESVDARQVFDLARQGDPV
ncbi:MAG: ROK family transcriptional regulator, partial [Bacillota bacterium]